ncbi:hypothetical protein [Photobacterium phosphoreum]|uniref:hypothetical protein n=1 Tax=Photobacterium phosphoreum TaxID=659 RepID=UPI000D179EF9|nr:hypothetical protein [Photobacterium phosphoreum]PSU60922.1 hypothetical protein CTM80_13540 [Photobacterium phosphoreum]
MKSRSEVSSLIEQEYTVLEKTIRKNSGSHSLKVEEFSNVGIRRVIVSKAKTKGVCIEFWSSEEQSEFLSENIGITQGSNTSSHGVWKYIDSLESAKSILESIMVSASEYEQHEIEEVEDEYNRSEIEELALSEMNNIDKAKYQGFWEVARKLNNHLGSIFHVDHAASIKQDRKSAISYKNLQILVKGINTSKNDSSWARLTYDEQREHILCCAQIIPQSDAEYVAFLIEQLRLYWD